MKLNDNETLTLLEIVDEKTDAIIVAMRQLVDDTKIYEKRFSTQVSNLVNLTRSTDSVEAIITWIQYQIGRLDEWKHHDFGESLVIAIKTLGEDACAEADRLASYETNPKLYDYVARYLWVAFVRQYAGHMQRYITYRTPRKDRT